MAKSPCTGVFLRGLFLRPRIRLGGCRSLPGWRIELAGGSSASESAAGPGQILLSSSSPLAPSPVLADRHVPLSPLPEGLQGFYSRSAYRACRRRMGPLVMVRRRIRSRCPGSQALGWRLTWTGRKRSPASVIMAVWNPDVDLVEEFRGPAGQRRSKSIDAGCLDLAGASRCSLQDWAVPLQAGEHLTVQMKGGFPAENSARLK